MTDCHLSNRWQQQETIRHAQRRRMTCVVVRAVPRSQEDKLPSPGPYRSVRSRSTDFGQVGFEPEQVPTALKPAFFLAF